MALAPGCSLAMVLLLVIHCVHGSFVVDSLCMVLFLLIQCACFLFLIIVYCCSDCLWGFCD